MSEWNAILRWRNIKVGCQGDCLILLLWKEAKYRKDKWRLPDRNEYHAVEWRFHFPLSFLRKSLYKFDFAGGGCEGLEVQHRVVSSHAFYSIYLLNRKREISVTVILILLDKKKIQIWMIVCPCVCRSVLYLSQIVNHDSFFTFYIR